jgi:hypothetical protein
MTFERQPPNEVNARPARMPEPRAGTVFLFAALMRRAEKISGLTFHDLIHRWLASGAETPSEQGDWLRENGAGFRPSGRQVDAARREADRWLTSGAWCAEWPPPGSRPAGGVPCPRVIFGLGSYEVDTSWIGFFNSRTPRLRVAGEEWLDGLRSLLPRVAASRLGLASSVGTLTYDLVTVYGQRADLPLLLWLPAPLEILLEGGAHAPFVHPFNASGQLTCLTGAAGCTTATRAVCRDRMLAELADLHCLLTIRKGGNMEALLRAWQTGGPRPRWVMGRRPVLDESQPSASSLDSGVERGLAGHATVFVGPEPQKQDESGPSSAQTGRMNIKSVHEVDWSQVLCHYTRSCAGPWPGQSYEDYLSELLDDAPHSRHGPFDTVIRILRRAVSVRAQNSSGPMSPPFHSPRSPPQS